MGVEGLEKAWMFVCVVRFESSSAIKVDRVTLLFLLLCFIYFLFTWLPVNVYSQDTFLPGLFVYVYLFSWLFGCLLAYFLLSVLFPSCSIF